MLFYQITYIFKNTKYLINRVELIIIYLNYRTEDEESYY